MGSYTEQASLIGAIPALSMLLCSLFLSRLKFSPQWESNTQLLTSAVLLTVIGSHLIPDMLDTEMGSNSDRAIGITLGYAFGLVFIKSVLTLCEMFQNQHVDKQDNKIVETRQSSTIENNKNNYGGSKIGIRESATIVLQSARSSLGSIRALSSQNNKDERALSEGEGGGESSSKNDNPLSFYVQALINAIVDGFIIGISVSDDPNAAYIVAAGLAIEMGFLGNK